MKFWLGCFIEYSLFFFTDFFRKVLVLEYCQYILISKSIEVLVNQYILLDILNIGTDYFKKVLVHTLTSTCLQMLVNDNEIFIKVQIRIGEKCYFVMWHFCHMCALMTLIIIIAIQRMQSIRILILGSLAEPLIIPNTCKTHLNKKTRLRRVQ